MKRNMNDHKNPPKTIEEVGIHIGYMSDSLTEIKQILKDSPTKKEFNDLTERVKELERDVENNYVSRNMFKIALGTVTVSMSIIIGLLTIWGYISK